MVLALWQTVAWPCTPPPPLPALQSTLPTRAAVDVPTNATLSAIVQYATAQFDVRIDGKDVPGVARRVYAGNDREMWTYTPTEPLPPHTRVEVSVGVGSWSFVTGSGRAEPAPRPAFSPVVQQVPLQRIVTCTVPPFVEVRTEPALAGTWGLLLDENGDVASLEVGGAGRFVLEPADHERCFTEVQHGMVGPSLPSAPHCVPASPPDLGVPKTEAPVAVSPLDRAEEPDARPGWGGVCPWTGAMGAAALAFPWRRRRRQ